MPLPFQLQRLPRWQLASVCDALVVLEEVGLSEVTDISSLLSSLKEGTKESTESTGSKEEAPSNEVVIKELRQLSVHLTKEVTELRAEVIETKNAVKGKFCTPGTAAPTAEDEGTEEDAEKRTLHVEVPETDDMEVASQPEESQDIETLAKQAEALYAEVEAELGGNENIKSYKQKSQILKDEVAERLGKKSPWRHDVIIHHLGLDGLIDVGQEVIKPIFDCLVEKIADKVGAVAEIPAVKGRKRAAIKVRTRYGGDASQLSDIVRATLRFKMVPEVLDNIYIALDELVYTREFRGARVKVTLIDDRFQNPRKGGYRDILLLLMINGYVCELQLNVDKILLIKESTGHKQYELTRKINDDLLDAAMRSDMLIAKRALRHKANPNEPRDMYELTPLHYAAHHGNAQLINLLVSNKADALSQDTNGLLPIHRAVLLGHVDTAEALLVEMESSKTEWILNAQIQGELAAAALEKFPDGRASFSTDFVQRAAKWEADHLPQKKNLLRLWAQKDCAEAFSSSSDLNLQDVVAPMNRTDDYSLILLDEAVNSGSFGVVKHLLETGCKPLRFYPEGNCTPKVRELLEKHFPGTVKDSSELDSEMITTIQITKAENIPPRSSIKIKAGGVTRMAPLEDSVTRTKKYKFPWRTAKRQLTYFEVDVFTPHISSNIPLRTNQELYSIVEGASVLEFTVCEKLKPDRMNQPQARQGKSYLKAHDIEGVLTGMTQNLLKETPEEPYEWMLDYLRTTTPRDLSRQ